MTRSCHALDTNNDDQRTVLFQHRRHLGLMLVVIVKEARVRVDMRLGAFLHDYIGRRPVQVAMKLSARRALHAMHWPHHLARERE